MKILLVHHTFPPASHGGSELHVAALAQTLAGRGHDVTVLHREQDASRPDHTLRRETRDGVAIIAIDNLHRTARGFDAYRDPGVARAAQTLLEELRPDIVHVHHLNGLSTELPFLARSCGAALVTTLHDFWHLCPLGQLLDVDLAVCPGPSPTRCIRCVGPQLAPGAGLAAAGGAVGLPGAGIAGRALARLSGRGPRMIAERLAEMREVLRESDVLLSPSRFLADRFARLGVAGIEVLGNGHAPLPPHPREAAVDGRLRVGFVGSVIPSKGVHILAQAWRLVPAARMRLSIHGPLPPYHGDTTYEARLRGVLDPVAPDAIQGAFAPHELPAILAALDVLVVPSIWEENQPLTVSEAFLAGVVPVVSGHGGLAEAVRHEVDGLHVVPGDAADLARALLRLADQPELRRALRAAAPQVPTLDDHTTCLETRYEDALRRRATRAGRVGVVVVAHGRPDETARAVASARDDELRPELLVVENGTPGVAPAGVDVITLEQNRGFAAGANAGLAALRARGCDRLLLLNNDALLERGALRALAEAAVDPRVGAVSPLVLREPAADVESGGLGIDLHTGRVLLLGHGDRPPAGCARRQVPALAGTVMLFRGEAWDSVGPLEESYFHGFEDADWSVRARRAGFDLIVLTGARARHAGATTLGREAPLRLYYAARAHLRAVQRLLPLRQPWHGLRQLCVATLDLAHALRQSDVPRGAACAAVLAGLRDADRAVAQP